LDWTVPFVLVTLGGRRTGGRGGSLPPFDLAKGSQPLPPAGEHCQRASSHSMDYTHTNTLHIGPINHGVPVLGPFL